MKTDFPSSSLSRRNCLRGAAITCLLSSIGLSAWSKDVFPARRVLLVSPFGPGGPNDIFGRTLAVPLGHAWRQPVNVENVTGAGGLIGTKRFIAGAADGHTLLIGASYLVTAPHLYKEVAFDPVKDFIPVSPPVESLLVFVSGAYSNLKNLLEHARKSGAPIRVASPGTGTLSHLGCELLRLVSGVPIVHVPYRGVGPALADVIAGHADMMLDGISSSLPMIRQGRLKALAVPDVQRNPLLPDTPSTAELGLVAVQVRAWNALFAHAETAPAITDLITAESTRILSSPEVAHELQRRGLELAKVSPSAFRERLTIESAHWKKVVSDARIKIE